MLRASISEMSIQAANWPVDTVENTQFPIIFENMDMAPLVIRPGEEQNITVDF